MSGRPFKEISVSQARVLAGKALFADDWIGELSAAEMRLLTGDNGIQRKMLPNGKPIRVICRCPSHLRKKLDLAIGRSERAYLQLSTAIDVMHDAGFMDVERAYDAEAFEKFLAKLRGGNSGAESRRVGKPADLIESVMRRMESDMRAGINIRSMKGKELAAKYKVSRNTATAARLEVLEKQAR